MRKILFVLLSLFFIFSVAAVPAFANGQNITLNKNETINADYFANGATVTVLGTVNGDAYAAGGTVTVDGKINGDIIAGGGTVNISGSAENVRVTGGTVTINGNIAKNVTVLGGTVTIEQNAKIAGSIVAGGGTINILSPIGKGATIGGGTVMINNSVNGNVDAGVGQLTLGSQAKINGNLYYTSNQKAQIAQGATVTGEVEQKTPEQMQKGASEKIFAGLGITWLIFGLANFISMLIIGLLLIAFAPNYVKRVAENIIEKPWWSLGIGVITIIVAPIIFVILLITVIGIPLAFLFIMLYLIALYFSKLFVIYLIGERLGRTVNPRLHMMWFFVIGLVIYQILVLIPVIGWLIDVLAVLFGLGSLLMQKKYMYASLRRNKTL